MKSTGKEGGNNGHYFIVVAGNSDSAAAALDPTRTLIQLIIGSWHPPGGLLMAEDATTKFTKKASATVESLQEDFSAMRDDLGKLSQHVVDLASAKGAATYKRVRKNFDATKGEATDAVREVRDNFADALDESLAERPYTTLMVALGVGFVMGAMWRR